MCAKLENTNIVLDSYLQMPNTPTSDGKRGKAQQGIKELKDSHFPGQGSSEWVHHSFP